ncbi:MAG: VanW family protein [Peptococcaceae bacterium]|nr:VanW family protein [Peptococcaceae bacterium]
MIDACIPGEKVKHNRKPGRKTAIFAFFLALLLVNPACVSTAGSGTISALFASGLNKYYVNGLNEVTMDARPFIKEGRFFVPVRYLGSALGLDEGMITWDGETRTVTLRGDITLQMTVGKAEVVKDGRPEDIDAAPVLTGGRTYLPARHVAGALGYEVEWDGASRTVLCWPKGMPKPDASEAKRLAMGEERSALIGEYEIIFPGNPEDDKNIQNAIIALGKVNGHTLAPGEVFSFNAAAKPRTLDNGYVVGYSYSGNQKVPDVGGGVCRASAVIYAAALNAGLPVIERHTHSVAVDYVPGHLDAAVWSGVLDLKFRNDRNVPLLIKASGSERRVWAGIWEVYN